MIYPFPITALRDKKGWNQSEQAYNSGLSRVIIGRYERYEVAQSIDVVKKLADAFDSTVDYLLSETKQFNFSKYKAMVKRLNDISALPEKDREHILYTIDGLIKSAKIGAM